MKAGVIVFPGSNCDRDTQYVLEELYRLDTVMLWHKDKDLQGCKVIFVPGGFSYGDYLRSGAIARFSPMMEQVISFANDGGIVVGICNGFQILCESHLLPGVLLRNESQKFTCKNVYIKSETNDSLLTRYVPQNEPLQIPIAHAEGRYHCSDEVLENLKKNDQILFRYCSPKGETGAEWNPNGSLDCIAGICNEGRNVFGMMPHPERAADRALANTDGRWIFNSLLDHLDEVVAQ